MADVLTQEPPSRIRDLLRRTAPWAQFIAIVMFIGSGFMILGGLLAAIGLAAGLATGLGEESGRQIAPVAVLGVLYAVFGAINLVPAIFLSRFAGRLRRYVAEPRAETLESALDAQRAYWKFMGVLMIAGIACAIVVAFAAVVVGALFMQRVR